jgi:hypothetical protein
MNIAIKHIQTRFFASDVLIDPGMSVIGVRSSNSADTRNSGRSWDLLWPRPQTVTGRLLGFGGKTILVLPPSREPIKPSGESSSGEGSHCRTKVVGDSPTEKVSGPLVKLAGSFESRVMITPFLSGEVRINDVRWWFVIFSHNQSVLQQNLATVDVWNCQQHLGMRLYDVLRDFF